MIKCDGTLFPVYPPVSVLPVPVLPVPVLPVPVLPVRMRMTGDSVDSVVHGGSHVVKQSTGDRPLQVRNNLLFNMLIYECEAKY